VWHDSLICVTWMIYVCDMTHSCGMTHSYECVCLSKWCLPVRMCDMTHWYVWHESFMCVTWLIHVAWLIHMSVCAYQNDLFLSVCVTWLIHMCDMTHSYECVCPLECDMTHWLFMCVTDSCACVTWLIHMSVCALKNVTRLTDHSCASQTHSHVLLIP